MAEGCGVDISDYYQGPVSMCWEHGKEFPGYLKSGELLIYMNDY
jgi:hypothetical protein